MMIPSLSTCTRRIAAVVTIAVISTTALIGSCRGAEGISALAPIQISPQRRQLIGVTLATVKERQVSDMLQATGAIEADERREVYVQTRFSGWIDRVYADQTDQFVSSGQPLFSIYSPDVFATEEEYLIALNAYQRVAGSTIEGVAKLSFTIYTASKDAPAILQRVSREL